VSNPALFTTFLQYPVQTNGSLVKLLTYLFRPKH